MSLGECWSYFFVWNSLTMKVRQPTWIADFNVPTHILHCGAVPQARLQGFDHLPRHFSTWDTGWCQPRGQVQKDLTASFVWNGLCLHWTSKWQILLWQDMTGCWSKCTKSVKHAWGSTWFIPTGSGWSEPVPGYSMAISWLCFVAMRFWDKKPWPWRSGPSSRNQSATVSITLQ